MSIKLLAIGRNMPAWVNTGFAEYAKRLPPEFKLELQEIKAEYRGKNDNIPAIIQKESELLIAAIPKDHHVIALDERGKQWNTHELAEQLQNHGRKCCLLVGGPDGLSDQCRARADQIWSLSKLTLPHPLVRVIIAEQLYRAWSILSHHPYHRD